MKKINLLCAVIFSALILVSCGKIEQTNTLKMNLSSEPDSFFPWNSAAADTSAIFDNIYEGLFKVDPSGKVNPALAESYSVSSDNLTYTFNLRKNVKFHNGEDFTSKDCIYTFENLAGLNGKTARVDKMHIVKSVSAPDDYTFIVNLKNPSGGFLALCVAPILLHDYNDNEKHPMGTGPYKFVEYKIHEKVTLTLNENYWDEKNKGKIQNIELYLITDENAILSALQSGQIHIAQMISGMNANHLSSKYNVISHPQNMVQIFGMNNNFPPLADENVRKAITCAINKKDIIEGVFDGYGTELYSNFSPILKEYYNDSLSNEFPYDIQKAKEYLAKSNYKDGFELTIQVPANYQPHVDTAQFIANQLSELNIQCKIVPIEWATWLDKVYSRADYEATVIAFDGKIEPAEVLRRYYSTYRRNFFHYKSSEFDKYFDLAESEVNQEKRVEYFKKCQEILTRDCPAVFICDPGRNILTTRNIAGYTPYPISMYDFAKIYFK